jgi:hypothetical protein
VDGYVNGLKYAAGIVGDSGYYGGSTITIMNCTNLANISGDRLIGGIVGRLSTSLITTLTNCVNAGIIKGNI